MTDKLTTKKDTARLRVDSAIFQRLARTVLHAVSGDSDRAHLNSLHILSSSDRLIVEGTDGICMAIWGVTGDFTAFDVLIPKERVAAFLRALPKPSTQTELFEDGYVRIGHGVLEGSGVSIEFQAPKVVFPDLASVTPKRRKGGVSPAFALHPAYLKIAAEVFVSATKGGCAPLMEGGNKADEMIRFSAAEAPGLLFVAAPCRSEADRVGVGSVEDMKEAAEDKPDVTTVTLIGAGKSVTLTAEDGKRLRKGKDAEA